MVRATEKPERRVQGNVVDEDSLFPKLPLPPSPVLDTMMQWEQLVQIAQEVIEETWATLPEEIKRHAEQVPVSLESSPSEDMQEEGITGDTLGLFVGESYDDIGLSASPMPGQILLFLENIRDYTEDDPENFREEVRITLLHELGHYFGWDERDLYDRDLD